MPDVSGRPRVLVVDDERVIADTLALILNKSGYIAKVAYSAEEALRLADLQPPDILISDVLLDGTNGIGTAASVANMAPGCRVLLISGQVIPSAMFQEANAVGKRFDVLLKPVHPQKLLSKLEEISGRAEESPAIV